jgi:hypothetical protein
MIIMVYGYDFQNDNDDHVHGIKNFVFQDVIRMIAQGEKILARST